MTLHLAMTLVIFLQMASITGKIQEFKPEGEHFSPYIDGLNLYFGANSGSFPCSHKAKYALFSDHFAPDKPKDKSLDELISVLKGHFEPKGIIVHLSIINTH